MFLWYLGKVFFCIRFMPNPSLKNAVFFCQAVAKFSFYCIRISNQVVFWDLSFFFMTDYNVLTFILPKECSFMEKIAQLVAIKYQLRSSIEG